MYAFLYVAVTVLLAPLLLSRSAVCYIIVVFCGTTATVSTVVALAAAATTAFGTATAVPVSAASCAI